MDRGAKRRAQHAVLAAGHLGVRRYASSPTRLRFALVVVLFALGLMSKPMVVTLPFTLLLLDWWPLNRLRSAETVTGQVRPFNLRPWLPLLVEKWPLFVMSVLSGVMTIIAQRQGERW